RFFRLRGSACGGRSQSRLRLVGVGSVLDQREKCCDRGSSSDEGYPRSHGRAMKELAGAARLGQVLTMNGPRPTPLTLPRGALAKLRSADPRMAKLIEQVGRCRLEAGKAGGHLAALVRSIVYQQLSGKAAATIHGRFAALFHPRAFPDPHAILASEDAALRACGLSRQKIASLRDLCRKVASGSLPLAELD